MTERKKNDRESERMIGREKERNKKFQRKEE